MRPLKLIEDGELTGIRTTKDGYLTGSVRCARTGIQEYRGTELGLNTADTVRVYRSEDEVFNKDSLASYVGRPATDNHPSEAVTASNWKQHGVGQTGEEVARDGEYVRVSLALMDQDTIQKVQDGKRQISMGYTMNLDHTAGTTPDGEAYDAVMTDLRMNHLAIVDRGRAGSQVRIGDHWADKPEPIGKPPMTTRTVLVDGLSVETTDAGAQAIEKLQGDVKAAQDAAQAAKDTAQTSIDAKDKELAAKDVKIKELEDAAVDDAQLDKLVADRADLIAKAQSIVPDADFTGGKTALDITTVVVDAVNGEGFCKDKAPAYVEAAFDMAKPPKGDNIRNILSDKKGQARSSNDNGQSAYDQRIADAWKPAKAGAQA